MMVWSFEGAQKAKDVPRCPSELQNNITCSRIDQKFAHHPCHPPAGRLLSTRARIGLPNLHLLGMFSGKGRGENVGATVN